MRNLALSALALAAVIASGPAFAAEATDAAVAAPNPQSAPAGDYKTDPKHRYITFTYSHFGYSHPSVRWRSWEADLDWNPSDPAKSSVTATIDATSIDTGVDALDKHLKSADFFDVAKYPTITFKSASIEKTDADSGTMTGELTIKGVTKPVTLEVTFNNGGKNPFGPGYKLGFNATGSLKRSDFGLANYVPSVGDEIDFTISAEFQSTQKDAQ